jgi:hypothetical protein
MGKQKPNGFVAKCQCGESIGALDARQTDNKEMSRLLGQWLFDGCTIEPRFACTWSEHITACKCK